MARNPLLSNARELSLMMLGKGLGIVRLGNNAYRTRLIPKDYRFTCLQ